MNSSTILQKHKI